MKKFKKFKIKNLVLVLSLALLSTSCDQWIDHDLNIDPDRPISVPMRLILPGVQQAMGYHLVGNNSMRTNTIWMQQFDGVSRQSYTEGRYQLTPADVNNFWTSVYPQMLMNSVIIVDKAKLEGSESPNFAGIAQVLMATTLGVTTDLFGDIPYTEAFQGRELNFKPVYDSQESIYSSIFTLLDQANANLDETENIFSVKGDVIYAGNMVKWKKAAASIRARHLLQLSGKNGNAAYTDALAAVANGFTSNADDMLVPFDDENTNPVYQFMDERGDIRMGSTLINMMLATNDPRLEFYAEKDANGNYSGSNPGSQNDLASLPGPGIASKGASTKLMTYAELKFIEAEAKFMLGQAGAQAAYEEAVAASVLRVTGNANTAWLAANVNGVAVTLEKIISAKYIDGIATNQPFADWRRTGFPVLSPSANSVISTIPTRFPYAQNELDYNGGNVPSVVISDKLWWDQ